VSRLRSIGAEERSTRAATSVGSLIRPIPTRPSASSPSAGADHLRPALDEEREVRLRRGVLPHRGVHRRGDDERAAMRQGGLGQKIVGVAVRETREGVRGERRDDEDVSRREVRIRVAGRSLRASAQNVSAATNRSAPAVVTGVTSCPRGRAAAPARTPCRRRSRR
jgi:hypothetical protein